MTVHEPPHAPPAKARKRTRRKAGGAGATLAAHGEPMRWMTSGGLAVCVAMVLGLLLIVLWNGIATFWPQPLVQVVTPEGRVALGEVTRSGAYRLVAQRAAALPPKTRARAERLMEPKYRALLGELEGAGPGALAGHLREVAPPGQPGWLGLLRGLTQPEPGEPVRVGRIAVQALFDQLVLDAERRLFRTGNFELTNEHFLWVSDFEVMEESKPEWAVTVERLTWGRFYGFPERIVVAGETQADARGKEGTERETAQAEIWRLFRQYHSGARARFRQRRNLEKFAVGSVNRHLNNARLRLRDVELREGKDSPAYTDAKQEYARIEEEATQEFASIRQEIAELNAENAKYAIHFSTAEGHSKEMGFAEIVRAYPANRLSFAQKAGVYLSRWREFLVDEPREANSEGGVFPAIFGTFVMTVLMSLAVAPFGVLAALYLREYAKAGPVVSAVRIAINNLAGVPSIVFGVFGLGFFCYIMGGTIDQIFFQANLPSPTFGTGGILWASLTLALLTAPVVIVATEEALAAVPGSMREGSYACGGSKWQTIRRIVLPRAMPGIMTGMILAMARGAGEVAPLMLTGAVKLAPELPVDGVAPYIHPQRSFMHLGFHIFDLGFQSQNSEAAKPMVFTTTLLLIAMIALLNVTAIYLRKRLRRKFEVNQF